MRIQSLLLLAFFATPALAFGHDGPDPILRYRLDSAAVQSANNEAKVLARLGPDAKMQGKGRFIPDESEGSLFLPGGECGLLLAEDFRSLNLPYPKEAITISFWGTVDKPQRWGGLASLLQDNGSHEYGWILGYDNQHFTFGLRSQDGPGKMTYLAGKTKYELGKTYHVAAVYDGKTMQIYVNGKLDAESAEQSGEIAYPKQAPFMIGAYRDADEFYGHRGRIRELAIYPVAAKQKWAEKEFDHHRSLTQKPGVPIYDPLSFEIEPYLQFGTPTEMTVMWKTNRPANSYLKFGETSECKQKTPSANSDAVHEIKLTELKPETQYFYQTVTTVNGSDETIESDVATFQTAVNPDTPFAFAVISDTQGNPKVSGKLAEYAWGQRPSFLLHPGDLVSTGPNDSHWTEHFFPSMNPLIKHVPFYPVLGNHEQNAKNYFDYVSLPTPEYYYTFNFGNTQFFMIDSNRNVDPNSEQYRWLEKQLKRSTAKWKFVCHHHPPYSSDENDYGNLWKSNVSTRGDLRVRKLVPLYEEYDVDFVWNGHIHSYERTWPLRNGKAVDSGGPIYMITGGGGGHLETPGPIRPFFQNTVRRGHHYSMVRINGNRVEIQVYDLENRLFDSLTVSK